MRSLAGSAVVEQGRGEIGVPEPVAHRLGSGAVLQRGRRRRRPERMRAEPLDLAREPRAVRVVAHDIAVDGARIERAV